MRWEREMSFDCPLLFIFNLAYCDAPSAPGTKTPSPKLWLVQTFRFFFFFFLKRLWTGLRPGQSAERNRTWPCENQDASRDANVSFYYWACHSNYLVGCHTSNQSLSIGLLNTLWFADSSPAHRSLSIKWLCVCLCMRLWCCTHSVIYKHRQQQVGATGYTTCMEVLCLFYSGTTPPSNAKSLYSYTLQTRTHALTFTNTRADTHTQTC